MAFMKTVKRGFRKARGKVIGRYFKKKSGYAPKVGRIAKDVARLGRMLNAEKKQFSVTGTAQKFAQLNNNAAGYYAAGITPFPSQGTGQGARTGNSIKLCSSWFTMSLWQQASLVTNVKFKLMIIKPKMVQTDLPTFISQIMEVTPYNNIIDYNSQFNPNYFGTYSIIYKRTHVMNLTNYATATTLKEIRIPLKWNHHIRYAQDGTNTVSDGQFFILILADSGNCGGTLSTVANVPVTAANSGIVLNYDFNYFYYDN